MQKAQKFWLLVFWSLYLRDISPVHVVLVTLLVDQLSSLFLIFLVDQKKFVQSQIFFVHSLEFFVQSFSKNEKLTGQLVGQETDQNHIFKKDWTKNSREWTKKIWYWTNFSLVDQKKWEIDQTIGRPRDWPKPHGQDFWSDLRRRYVPTSPNTTTYRTAGTYEDDRTVPHHILAD